MERIDPSDRARRGAAAEDLAAAYLRLRGCEVIARNVRVGRGEIDLIARRGSWLLLIEVRCRQAGRFGQAVETVTGRKARALSRAARAYVARERAGSSCWRLDVVTVTLDADGGARIQHYPGAVPIEETDLARPFPGRGLAI